MKLGTTTIHPKYGPVEVVNLTAGMICYRLADGTKRRERRPESRKWRVGMACRVTPDQDAPERTCRGIVVALRADNMPTTVRVEDPGDAVWDGAILEVGKYGAKVTK